VSVTECKICGKNFEPKKSASILISENGEQIGICSECSGTVYRGGMRYNVDVMVVPVKPESLKKALEDNLYICPAANVRKNPKFIAFYQGGKLGIIAYLAKVGSIEYNTKSGYKTFKLENLVKLKNPIKRGSLPPIQARIYVTFEKFSKASCLKDLK
jgi:hypothetical protein